MNESQNITSLDNSMEIREESTTDVHSVPEEDHSLNGSTDSSHTGEKDSAPQHHPTFNKESYLRKLGGAQAEFKNVLRRYIMEAIIEGTVTEPRNKLYVPIKVPFTTPEKDADGKPVLNAHGFPMFKKGFITYGGKKFLYEDLLYGRKNDRVQDHLKGTTDPFKNRNRHNIEFDSLAQLQQEFNRSYGWFLLDESDRPDWNEAKSQGKSNMFVIRLYFKKPKHYDTAEELWHGKNKIPFLSKKKEEKPSEDLEAMRQTIRQEVMQELQALMMAQPMQMPTQMPMQMPMQMYPAQKPKKMAPPLKPKSKAYPQRRNYGPSINMPRLME